MILTLQSLVGYDVLLDTGHVLPAGQTRAWEDAEDLLRLSGSYSLIEAAEAEQLRIVGYDGPVASTNADRYLATARLERDGAYAVPAGSSAGAFDLGGQYIKPDGSVPFTAPIAGVTPTAPQHLASRQWVLDQMSGGGITEAQHELLDTLVHGLAETSYQTISRVDGRIAGATVWTSEAALTAIRDVQVLRSGGLIAGMTIRQYNASGVVCATLRADVVRTGGRITAVNWSRS